MKKTITQTEVEVKHTPLPYNISHNDDNGDIVVRAKDNNTIVANVEADYYNPYGNDNKTIEANAAFIVKACNSHYTLLEALKEALIVIERMSDEYSKVAKKHASFTNGEYKRINEAIKQAE